MDSFCYLCCGVSKETIVFYALYLHSTRIFILVVSEPTRGEMDSAKSLTVFSSHVREKSIVLAHRTYVVDEGGVSEERERV